MSISESKSRVFGSAADLLKETSKLQRLVKFDSILRDEPGDDRQKLLNQVAQIWSAVLETSYASLEECKRSIELTHRKLPCEVADIFLEQVENAVSVEEIKEIAKKILKDRESVPLPPIKKSQRGNKGPTFLVSYPRTDLLSHFSLIAYVIKWTTKEEIACNQLYHAFANQLSKNKSIGFVVPINIGLDFKDRIFKKANGDMEILDQAMANKLSHTFFSIARSYSSSIELHGENIVISERIQGENLFDFARSKYAQLSQTQKIDLFTQIAKIIPLDIIFGNIDRLLQIWMDSDNNYAMDTYEANLGNVMIAQEPHTGNPTIYSIDNGIFDTLVSNTSDREKYLRFIKSLFNSPNSVERITKCTIDNFKTALATQPDDMGCNIVELKKQLQPFSDDLSTLALPAVAAGVQEMLSRLRHELIPEWSSEKSAALKKQIATVHPDLLPIIEERIHTFQHCMEPS